MSEATHAGGPTPTMSFEAPLAGLGAAGEVTRLASSGFFAKPN
jgi:hypothetical protein